MMHQQLQFFNSLLEKITSTDNMGVMSLIYERGYEWHSYFLSTTYGIIHLQYAMLGLDYMRTD